MKETLNMILKHPYWTGIGAIATIIGIILSLDITGNTSNNNNLLKQISVIEIANAEFNEKRAREDIEVSIDDTKKTDAYLWKVKCEKLIDYKDNYVINTKKYKEKIAIDAIKACTNASKLNSNNLYYLYLLSLAYHKNKDYDKSLKIIKSLAIKDYSIAQRKLGIMYYFGYIVEKDTSKSKELIFKAAQNGDKASQEMIDNNIMVN
jgi:hypothetical protein